MALWLREAEVGALLSMDDVMAAVEQGFRLLGEGSATNHARTRSITSGGKLNVVLGEKGLADRIVNLL